MPPRGTNRGAAASGPPRGGPPGRGRGGPPRGGPGRGAPRGGPPLVGQGSAGPGTLQPNLPAQHVQTVGVKRTAFGRNGRALNVLANMFQFSASPDIIIHHYDVVFTSNDKSRAFPAKFNLEIIKQLQERTAPQIFTPKAVFDGRKNMFSSHALALGAQNKQQFDVTFGTTGNAAPTIYSVTVTKVAEINTETLYQFLQGKQAQDNQVLTAIMALNVVIRMDPISKYSFNVRSFFHEKEMSDLGFGLHAWRGYFQSVRPASGRLLLNLDIASGVMYQPGPLIGLCLAYLGHTNPNALSPAQGFNNKLRLKLQRHITGMRITTGNPPRKYTIQGLSVEAANNYRFQHGNQTVTVAQYFASQNQPLQFPGIVCAKVSATAYLPLERCTVLPGQIVRKELPEDAMRKLLAFSTKKPQERLQSIRAGTQLLAYGQSDYIRQFGIEIDTAAPLKIAARVLQPPMLKYGVGSKQATITPRDGSWNMQDKKMIKPAQIRFWVILIFEAESRFRRDQVQKMIQDFIANCKAVGMEVKSEPHVKYANSQGKIGDIMKEAGRECMNKQQGPNKSPPEFIVAVLPDFNNADLYKAIKFHGDTTLGVATQCLKVSNCRKSNAQYWANVLLKVNPKLAGLNWEGAKIEELEDPNFPTLIMGADVIHPGPGNTTSPSFAALTASVNTKGTYYTAQDRVQTARKEIIEELGSMCEAAIGLFINYRKGVEKVANGKPRRIIFYRDGVSEGQFQQVLDLELPMLKQAMANLDVQARVTFIIVGKRHHIRFFPENPQAGDRSGNCPAGTVVDKEITHPLEFDFYLQSHGGLLGTSRSAHYSVLHDENNFSPDSLQALSFALCHVYARSTRSVSIPAPVYYADLVCYRAKTRFDPQDPDISNFSDAGSTTGTATSGRNVMSSERLDKIKKAFKPLHTIHTKRMYFL